MPKIKILDDLTANQIAAGEVIERPFSVVKELVENALDAEAKNITIDLENGGLSLIRVTDDGYGMSEDDLLLAIKRHATSKLISISDLDQLKTLGFRGEALPSIVSVAKVELISREVTNSYGTRVLIEGNKLITVEPSGTPVGTTITVSDLFFNTPARRKFLHSHKHEGGLIHELLIQFSLSHSQVNFRLSNNGKEVLNTTGINTIPDLLELFYGKLQNALVKLEGTASKAKISGYVTLPNYHRPNRKGIFLFINSRKVVAKELSQAVEDAYEFLLPKGRFPLAVIHVSLPPALLDVNVHPGKLEVRMRDEFLSSELCNLVKNALQREKNVPQYFIKPSLLAENITPNSPLTRPERVQERWEDFTAFIPPEKLANPTLKNSKEELVNIPLEANITTKVEEFDKPLTVELLPNLQIIGQLWATFILAEGEDAFYIIDQHVAHERVIFERLVKETKKGKTPSQVLLTPITLHLSVLEEELIIQYILPLKDIGVILEHFGPHTYLLRAVPTGVENDPEDFFYALLELMEQKKGVLTPLDFRKQILIIASCKGAIKARQKLSISEMNQLLNDLRQTNNPLTCPHGRPIIYKIAYTDILKAFRRQ